MKNKITPSELSIETMHSGRSCLNLTSSVDWECFPDYANFILELLGGSIISKSDGADVRIWEVLIDNEYFFLAFDDFPVMITLESKSPQGDDYLPAFKALLVEKS
jgi:hypothetical protein